MRTRAGQVNVKTLGDNELSTAQPVLVGEQPLSLEGAESLSLASTDAR
jgi:hypothetical protein